MRSERSFELPKKLHDSARSYLPMTMYRYAFALFVATSIKSVALAAPAYHSPWDAHPVKETSAAYSCPEPAHLPVDFVTDGFYADNDPTHSIIDPVKQKAYAESSGPVKREGDLMVAVADQFRKTGSAQAAKCVLQHLEVQAKEGLYSISKKYGVSVQQLKEWNNLASDNLAVGQQLIVSK